MSQIKSGYSGFMSNRYSYDSFTELDGNWKDNLGAVGGVLLGAAATGSGFGALTAGGMTLIGTFAGKEIGTIIDNSEIVIRNTETFLKEINDWRSWADQSGAAGWAL